MSLFSSDVFKSILSGKGLCIKDNNFIDSLDKNGKNLLIGENGAGKTRLLQSIEEYYNEELKKAENNIVLFPIYCSKMDISTPEKDEKKWTENEHDDVRQGIIWQTEPKEKILDINEETFLQLIRHVKTVPEKRKELALEIINSCLKDFLNKEIIIKDDLMITRSDGTSVKLLDEWDFLSPGERIIILLSLLIEYLDQMNDFIDKKDVIILLDEPELHLHPKVMLLIVERLIKYFSKGISKDNPHSHLFIASHSVFLIPVFDFNEQIYMKSGKILRKDSKMYSRLYGDLIGLENKENGKVKNLFDFLGSVYQWEYNSYISECFREPVQVEKVNSEDIQTIPLLHKVIYEKIKEKGVIYILDYGCGKVARIGRNIAMHYKLEGRIEESKKMLKYFAYDKYNINDLIETFKNSDEIPFLGEIIEDEDALKKMTFDVILLFNVLHEMSVDEWEKEINLLLNLLKDDGLIVFSERKTLSIGEKPYGKSGFLVFSDDEIKTMFDSCYVEKISDMDDPVISTIIRKGPQSSKITYNTIVKSLENLVVRMDSDINAVLENKKDLSPRNYAFYCQQYFNAKQSIKQLIKIRKFEIPDDFINWNLSEIKEFIDDEEKWYFYLRERAFLNNDQNALECRKELKKYEDKKNAQI